MRNKSRFKKFTQLHSPLEICESSAPAYKFTADRPRFDRTAGNPTGKGPMNNRENDRV